MIKEVKIFFAAFTVLMAVGLFSSTAQAQAACYSPLSSTFLHLSCAESISYALVEGSCCRVLGTERYNRINANRVDVRVRAYRNGQNQCRWTIARGTDQSKYAVYHPNYSWTTNYC